MLVNAKSKRTIKIQNVIFYISLCVILGLLAFLSTRYVYVMDWTYSKSNTAAPATQALLKTLKDKVIFTAFVSESNKDLKNEIQRLFNMYKLQKPDMELKFVDPVKEPGLVREVGVTMDGELHLEYQDRTELVQSITEQAITNALQRLARSGERWLVFIEGHNERNPLGGANYDYTNFKKQLEAKGIKIKTLNLATVGEIPDNTSALVIADPRKNYLPGEVNVISRYLDKGGNLFWLVEPGSLHKLDPIAEQLGVDFLDGTVVDLNTQMLGINDPRFALVAEYPAHPITLGFDTLTVFPGARGIEFTGAEDWDNEVFLETLPRTWLETDEMTGELVMDPSHDIAGPIVLGMTLSRNYQPDPNADDPLAQIPSDDGSEKTEPPPPGDDSTTLDEDSSDAGDTVDGQDAQDTPDVQDNLDTGDQQQRIVLVSDADFLSDAYLGQGGNMELGLNIINWLTRDESLINIPPRVAPDTKFELSPGSQAFIAFSFLIILPLLLLGSGVAIWVKRRKA